MSTPHTKNPLYTSPPETPVAPAAGLFSPGLRREVPQATVESEAVPAAAGLFSPGLRRVAPRATVESEAVPAAAGLFSPGLQREVPAAAAAAAPAPAPPINVGTPHIGNTLKSENGNFGFKPKPGNAALIAARRAREAIGLTPYTGNPSLPKKGCAGASFCSIQGGGRRTKKQKRKGRKSRKQRK